MGRQTFLLPIPPSTNRLFFNRPKQQTKGKGRIKTDEYRAWRRTAGWELKLQHVHHTPGPVALHVDIADNGDFDLSNTIKATEDLLVEHGIIAGDGRSIVREVRWRWEGKLSDGLMNVTILPVLLPTETPHDDSAPTQRAFDR